MWKESWMIGDEALFRALGWTLVHTLWQGVAIALLAAVLHRVVPRRDAHARYLIAVGALLLVPVAAGIAFWLQHRVSTMEVMPAGDVFAVWQVGDGRVDEVSEGAWSGWMWWLDRWAPHVAVFWLIGCMFFLLRLVGGVSYLWWLRSEALPLDAQWQERVDRLVRKVGLRRVVRVASSWRVGVPVAFGLVKPIILLPAALMTQLPPAAVEAVVLHELMHIRRRDFVVRLLQGLVEAVFYYHPAVWWLSAVVSREREYACDDAVVRRLGDRVAYARALMMSGELAGRHPVLALGLRRRHSGLLARIQRMLDPTRQNHSLMERTIAIVLLVAALSVSVSWVHSRHALPAVPSKSATTSLLYVADGARDTLPPRPREAQEASARMIKVEDGRTIEIEMVGETITEVVVDGKAVPPDSLEQYRKEVEAMRREMAQLDLFELDTATSFFSDEGIFEQAEIFFEEDFESDTSIAFDMNFEMDTVGLEDEVEDGWYRPRARMEWHMEHLERQLDRMEEELDRLFEYQDEAIRRRLEEAMKRAERAMEHLQEEWPRVLPGREWKHTVPPQRHADIEEARHGRLDSSTQSLWMERLERALLRDGLIKEGAPWSLVLSDRKMKVNGKSVPAQIHRKYVELYERFHGKGAQKWKVRYAVPGERTSKRSADPGSQFYWWNWWY